MKHYRPQVFFLVLLLVLAAAIMLACGSPTAIGTNQSHGLESITLSPATADASGYPGGLVQFVATGHYTTPPSPVTPIVPQVWGACYQNAPVSVVSVTSKGLAQCLAGSSGTYTVFASDMTNCLAIGPCGAGCQITGTAQLTCP
jgi:hypothetical protein